MSKRRLQDDSGFAAGPLRPAELDDDAIGRMLDGAFDEGLFREEPTRSEMMIRLFEFALHSLKQADESAERNLAEARSFQRDWKRRSAELDASQRETRRLIEDLIGGR